MTSPNKNTSLGTEIRFGLPQLLHLFTSHWKIFLLCVMACLASAKLGLKYFVHGNNTYRMVIASHPNTGEQYLQPVDMTQNPYASYNPAWKKSFTIDLFRIAESLNATQVLKQAVKEVQADVRYIRKGNFQRSHEIYNQSPILVQFLDAAPEVHLSIKVNLDDLTSGEVQLSDFHNLSLKTSEDKQITASLGTPVGTPLGRILVTRDDPSRHYPIHTQDIENGTLFVSKLPLTDAVRVYDDELQITMNAESGDLGHSARLELEASDSERRVLEVLNALVGALNDNLRKQLQKDMAEYVELLQQSISRLEESGASDTKQLRRQLEAQLQQTLVDQQSLEKGEFVTIIDQPWVQAKRKSPIIFYAIALIIGIMLPLFVLYLLWVIKGAIVDRAELSPFWRKRLRTILRTRHHFGKKDTADLEEISIRLQQEGLRGNKRIIAVTPTATHKHLSLMHGLTVTLRKRGLSVATVRLATARQATRNYDGLETIVLQPGLLGSKELEERFRQMEQEHQLLFIIPPAINKSDAGYILMPQGQQILTFIYEDTTALPHLKDLEQGLSVRALDNLNLSSIWVE